MKGQTMTLVLEVVSLVADRTGIPVASIMSQRRHAPVVKARHAAWAILRRDYGWSYPAIGRAFGRDHTTVLAAIRKVPDPVRVRVAAEVA